MEFGWSALWFIVAVSLLVTVHEFGHFWVARKLGFKVLRFSVGFGKPLLKKIGRGPDHIVEVKEPSFHDTPAWLLSLLEQLEPADQFSKFRDGMRCLSEWRATGSNTFGTSSGT